MNIRATQLKPPNFVWTFSLFSQFPRVGPLPTGVYGFRAAFDSAHSLCTFEVYTEEPLWNTSYKTPQGNISRHNTDISLESSRCYRRLGSVEKPSS